MSHQGFWSEHLEESSWELLLTVVEKSTREADMGFYIKRSIWDILSSKCLLDIQVEMLNRQLDTSREARMDI